KIESTNNMNAQKLEIIESMKNKLTNKYELNIQSFLSAGLPKEKLEWRLPTDHIRPNINTQEDGTTQIITDPIQIKDK
ncbi:10532_t:CDS:2, partial [Diversispora eburnea]